MAKTGVLFSNLGTPKSTDPKDVGNYLGEFLMDHHVIQIPYLVRLFLVRGIIVPFRKSKSAGNYKKVWTDKGSPLLVETEKAAEALQKALGEDYKVVVGMRYGEPSFRQAKEKLSDCDRVLFFPQYPQYAASTVQTGLDHFEEFFPDQQTDVIEPYFAEEWFLQSYTTFLKEALQGIPYDHILMSFHGLPETHLQKADPSQSHCLKVSDCCSKAAGDILNKCYRAQCLQSAQGLAEGLGLNEKDYSISFQSRLGRQKWIEPYTEDMYKALVERGVKNLAVLCPGFSVDGLETLEEIAMEGRECFLEAGGEGFHYIPCLNDNSYWIEACAQMIRTR